MAFSDACVQSVNTRDVYFPHCFFYLQQSFILLLNSHIESLKILQKNSKHTKLKFI